MPAKPPPKLGYAVAAGLVLVAVSVVTALVLAGGSDESPRPSEAGSASAVPGQPAEPGQAGTDQAALSPAEQELVGLLDPFTLRNCVSAPTATGVDAAVVCEADGIESLDGEGVNTVRLRVVRYVDAAAMTADVTGRAAAVTDAGSCRRGEDSVEDWGRNVRRLGTFICWSADARSNVFWTADAQRLGFEASEDDRSELADLVAWKLELEPLR